MKCRINRGEVIVADLGIEKLRYIGPAVNYASRFAGLAQNNDIMMSQTTNSRFKIRKFMASSERKSVKELHHAKSFGDVEYRYLLLSPSPHPGTS